MSDSQSDPAGDDRDDPDDLTPEQHRANVARLMEHLEAKIERAKVEAVTFPEQLAALQAESHLVNSQILQKLADQIQELRLAVIRIQEHLGID